jgi:membrane protein YdbS with pleckstrin-like domain
VQIGVVVVLLLAIGALHYFFKPEVFSWHMAFALFIWLGLLLILPGNFANTDYRQTAFRTLGSGFCG